MKLLHLFQGRTDPNPIAFKILLGLLSIITFTSFACSALTPKPTPTPTTQIGAIEIGTPELKGNKKDFEIWTGAITSETSRQYMSKGTVVNNCTTDWITDLDFAIDPSGNLIGTGAAKLSPDRNCTSDHKLVDNTSAMTISIQGRKDSSAIYLRLGIISREPAASGDFGGYSLLNSSGTCPSVEQTIKAPLTSTSTAEEQLNLSVTMTGCGGSKDDVMTNQSLIKLQYRFKCSELPADINDPVLEQLCH